MQEQATEVPPETGEAEKPTSTPHTRYDSNPFTAASSGIQKLIKANAQTVVGVVLFNILLFVILGLTAVTLFLAIAAFVVKRNADFSLPDNTVLEFLNSMDDTGIYLTWAIGLVICLSVVALTQSLQLNLAIAAAKNQSLKFGALLKASVRSVLPILGFVGLTLLAIVVGAMVIALLAPVLGYITIALAFVAVIAMIYAGIRLSYVTYSIVDKHLGPIAAIKDSWAISRRHLIETVGSGAVAWLILAIPSLIMSALARITEGAPMVSGLFSLLDMVLLVVLVIGAAMSVAERYVQLQAVATKRLTATPLSPFNYLAILLVVFLAPILNALSPQLNTGSNTQDLTPLEGIYDNTTPTYDLEDGSMYRVN